MLTYHHGNITIDISQKYCNSKLSFHVTPIHNNPVERGKKEKSIFYRFSHEFPFYFRIPDFTTIYKHDNVLPLLPFIT